MKLHLLKFALIVFTLSYSAFAQWSEIKQNQINTYGNATIYYDADRVSFNFEVIGYGPTLKEAVQQANDRVSKIGKKLKAVGLKEKSLQTSYFNSADNPDGKSWWTSSKDFAAAFEITVTLDSFELVEPSINALSDEPIEHLSNLRFPLKDDSLKQLEVLKVAAEDAKRKAELIATTLGAKVARVLFVNDQSSFSTPSVEINAKRPPEYIFSGKQFPITSRIQVYFELGYTGQNK